jgi:hypothetical protein
MQLLSKLGFPPRRGGFSHFGHSRLGLTCRLYTAKGSVFS